MGITRKWGESMVVVKKRHSYELKITKRTCNPPRGCPYCTGRRVCEDNNLKFLFPKV